MFMIAACLIVDLVITPCTNPPIGRVHFISQINLSEVKDRVISQRAEKNRSAELDSLFLELKRAKDRPTALRIEKVIWQIWTRSGSAEIDSLMAEAIKAMRSGNLETSIKILDLIIMENPRFAEAFNKRATVLFYLKRYRASIDDINRVLALEPRHFGALSGLGMVLLIEGKKKAALEAFRKALRVHPLLPGAGSLVPKLEAELEGQPL